MSGHVNPFVPPEDLPDLAAAAARTSPWWEEWTDDAGVVRVRPCGMLRGCEVLDDHAGRRVASTVVAGWWVSTVFLAIDHSMRFGTGPHEPLLYETMGFPLRVAANEDDRTVQGRYATREQALAGHRELVAHLAEQLRADTPPGGWGEADDPGPASRVGLAGRDGRP